MRSAALKPFTIERVDHLVLRVEHLERSVAFYEQVVGCKVARRRDDLGMVHMRAGASMLDLVSVSGTLGRRGGGAAGKEMRNMDHFCLKIEPFDEQELRLYLSSHSVNILGGVFQNFGAEGTSPSLYFNDPDGNLIEFKGAPVDLPEP